MPITNIQQGKKDAERVNIFIDEEFSFAIEKETLIKFHLYQGKVLTEEERKEIMTVDAVQYLTRRLKEWWFKRPRGPKELQQKLRELFHKRYEDTELELQQIEIEVLQILEESGYSGKEFARWLTRERKQQGKYGSKKIKAELVNKGVSVSLADTIIQEENVDDQALRVSLLQDRFGVDELAELTDQKLKAKAWRWLQSRGV